MGKTGNKTLKLVKKTPKKVAGGSWLDAKIAGSGKKTVCIVADQGEIKDGKLNGILPEGLTDCKDFRQDLNM